MKKSFKTIATMALLVGFPSVVNAAGTASISGPSSVEVGSSVTASVTVKNTAAWNIKINSSGSTSGCSQSFADATGNGNNTTKTFSVTCKATSVGAIGFTVTGDITSSDGANSNVSLSKRVTVTEVKPKSTDNYLKSLGVEGYSINPEFNKDTLEYTATVPSTVDKINITATKNDSTASIDGTGEKEVVEGANEFEIVVTSQSGSTRTYKLKVIVEDINPIEVTINNKKYTVVKRADKLEAPIGFEETTLTIGEFEIPSFKSEILGLNIVGLIDEDGNIAYATYEDGNYELYNSVTSNANTLYIIPFKEKVKGFIKTKIEINGVEIEVYKRSEKSEFALVQAKNVETGEEGLYVYDLVEKTFQRYDGEEILNLQTKLQNYAYIIIAFAGCLALLFLCMIINAIGKRKAKKKLKRKKEEFDFDMKEEKKEAADEIIEEKKKSNKKK